MFFNNSSKIAIIGDIHVGKSKDSQIKQHAIDASIDWAIAKLIEEHVDRIVIAGDIHDNRNAVTLISMGSSDKIISRLAEHFKVVILAGNHDTAKKEGCSDALHSLHMFKHMPNVKIAVSSTLYEEMNGKKIAIVPWGDDLSEVEKQKPDVAIGHFEYSGAKIAGGVSKGSLSMKDLSKLATVVLSGHYHIREERMIDGHQFISVGSLIELDWGDAGTSKGLHIVDLNTLDVKFIECKLRPKHVYLTLSKLATKQESISKASIEGNYIKLIVDIKVKYDAVRKLVAAINNCNPIVPCVPEFQQAMTIEHPAANMKRISESITDKKQYLVSYVDRIDSKMMSKSSIDDIKKSLSEYYELALQKIG
jgi:DNA repair exonuclease SbcCD nuclease subunit